MRTFHRIAACLALSVVATFALAATASAKEGYTATLTSTIPASAKAGKTIRVSWKVTDAAGNAFNATGVFVRLRGPARGVSTEGMSAFGAHTDGAYTAKVKVPRGGIAKVEIGIAGTRTYANGKSERADLLFQIANPPKLTVRAKR